MLTFGRATCLSFLLKSMLSGILNNSLWESDNLIFPESINVVSIYTVFKFTIL